MPSMSTEHIYPQAAAVSRSDRERLNGHRGAVLWLTGLSGAGKSTIAHGLEELLFRLGRRVLVLDGDKLRTGLCSDLGFSSADRQENLRRAGEVAKLALESGLIVIAAFIAPFQNDRDSLRSRFAAGDFFEIYCRCTLELCEQRDPKGLYKLARAGRIAEFTGISSPYEAPAAPDLIVDTSDARPQDGINAILALLAQAGVTPA